MDLATSNAETAFSYSLTAPSGNVIFIISLFNPAKSGTGCKFNEVLAMEKFI
jgi:hypothetical protein